ncbi:uncharacterized protein TNCV_1683291 [Trichonephila clavipes]|nr:uncharacterized protein TNCV_1683291 [Trichonephila clavipes]
MFDDSSQENSEDVVLSDEVDVFVENKDEYSISDTTEDCIVTGDDSEAYGLLLDFERRRVVGLREANWTNRCIGYHFGWSVKVVARCWQQCITKGIVYCHEGSGNSRNSITRDDSAIIREATSSPTTSLESIKRHLPPSRHPVVSRDHLRTTIKTTTNDSTSQTASNGCF